MLGCEWHVNAKSAGIVDMLFRQASAKLRGARSRQAGGPLSEGWDLDPSSARIRGAHEAGSGAVARDADNDGISAEVRFRSVPPR